MTESALRNLISRIQRWQNLRIKMASLDYALSNIGNGKRILVPMTLSLWLLIHNLYLIFNNLCLIESKIGNLTIVIPELAMRLHLILGRHIWAIERLG